MVLLMETYWVDAADQPIEIAPAGCPDQLELPLGLQPTARPELQVRYWRPSLAPEELDDFGSFDYGTHPEIFLGRSGLGPLRIGCDTNILIDILSYGRSVLDELDGADRELVDDEQIRALLAILWLWTCRDIRLVFAERQATDCRPKAAGRLDVEERHGQLQELNAGWFHVIRDDPAENPIGDLPLLPGLPANTDSELMAIAIRAGCHVFLTRDIPVARRAPRLRPFGLAVMRPSDLLDQLAAANDLDLIGAEGGVCDNHKWIHLERVAVPGV
jgi:hypothetical protein